MGTQAAQTPTHPGLTPAVLGCLLAAMGVVFSYSTYGFLGFSLLVLLFAGLYLKPLAGLALVLLFAPVKTIIFMVNSPVRHSPDIIHLYFVPILLTCGVAAVRLLSGSIRPSERNDLLPVLAAIWGWSVITLFWTGDANHGWTILLSLTECVLVLPLFPFLLRDARQVRPFLVFALFVGLAIAGLTTLSYWYHGKEIYRIAERVNFQVALNMEQDRPGGLAPVNHTSNLLNLFIVLAVALFPRVRSRWSRLFIVLAFLFLEFNVFFTGSKGGVGSLLVGLVFLIVAAPALRRRAPYWLTALGFSVLVAVVSTSLVTGEGIFQQRTVASASVASISFSKRLEFWRIGLLHIGETMGIGDGIGGFARFIDPWPAAHSLYFSILFDLGVIGFVLFAWLFLRMVFAIVRGSLACKDPEVSFTASCVTAYLLIFLVHGLVDFDYAYFPVWVMASFLFSLLRIGRTDAPGPPDAQAVPHGIPRER